MRATTRTITVALRATDPLSLAGLARMLADDPDVTVAAGPGTDADVLVQAAERVDARVVPVLRRSSIETRRPVVLVVDGITRNEMLLAVECRVVDVLPTAAVTADRLGASIRAAVGAGGCLPAGLAGELIERVRRREAEVLHETGLGASGLTPREVAVIKLMAEGLETAEIGTRLHCSERTVKSVISGIIRRLDLRNRSHIIAHAMRYGVI
ncbi:helix-turn-helix transcriptional regulator [Symbioplanes lichenis]|uniref:helix-turn-helix transcriptional regulator n=1 Tax=Symbioplanes lichenis TaxID=1629072 RepID=UPI00273A528D|nr:LuxR C-terminal-related transcriptional regulator [Actinoplanes lichenis]